ncbi:serine protease inhibitor 42Dd [Drosophila sulfurigaster albostrigata]|uniref:serine protease inhibitor 42Dd n=1 Tax=Drosophila sulfurigaster albostrigata TaxID=89887 RepID=UPI002D21ACFB|nr:serine protease inhibitor 42Dd [Drosophila sulfurigaster albostrigata]
MLVVLCVCVWNVSRSLVVNEPQKQQQPTQVTKAWNYPTLSMTTDNWRRLLIVSASLLTLLAISCPASGNPAALSSSSERFALRLATSLGLSQPHSNVAVSPLLLQSALTLLYTGVADDATAVARQLRVALDLQYLGTGEQALQQFQQLIAQLKESSAIGCKLRLLSEFYTDERYTFNYRDAFMMRAATLGIGMHRLDFDNVPNYEFLARSNYSVGELVTSSMLHATTGSDTPFLHVSALTFDAPWAQGFDPQQTQRINFFSHGHSPKLVDAMFVQHSFRYAELPALDACIIELPYASAELSLFIIYPNQLEGLAKLERQLSTYDLQQLRHALSERKLALTLPKFSLLAHTELHQILQHLGLDKLFSSEAQLHKVFSSILASSAPHLTAVPHTALFEVKEAGGQKDRTFAAAFTDLFRSTLSLVINHPFFYALGNGKSVLLAGHVVDI